MAAPLTPAGRRAGSRGRAAVGGVGPRAAGAGRAPQAPADLDPAGLADSVLDVAVVGAGLVGLATAMALLKERPGLRLAVLEKERSIASHQSGHNSGVIHAGLYYPPGSLKARFCREGRRALMDVRGRARHPVPAERKARRGQRRRRAWPVARPGRTRARQRARRPGD